MGVLQFNQTAVDIKRAGAMGGGRVQCHRTTQQIHNPAGSDIGIDRVVDESEAGLGGGLDQAEEAQLGVQDAEGSELPEDEGGLPGGNRRH